MDIPEKYRTYKINITNNVDKAGFHIYVKILGDEKYIEIESGQVYSHSDTTKYIIELFKKTDECQESNIDEYAYIRTIPSSLTPISITLENKDVSSYCYDTSTNNNITIKNDLYDGYEVIAIDNIQHENYIIYPNESFTIIRREKFQVNISLRSDTCFHGEKINTIDSQYKNYYEVR